jgi:hypothetical protein
LAIKAVVSAQARGKIRELLKRVTEEKGPFYLAMLMQSTPDIPDRWTLAVSAPWIDTADQRSVISYLSSYLKRYLDKNALSAIDRISVLRSADPLVKTVLELSNDFLGVKPSLSENEFLVRNWVLGGLKIPQGFIFVADPNAHRHSSGTSQAMQKVSLRNTY